MVTLTQEMKDMITTQQCFVGTVNADGTPNVAQSDQRAYYLMILLFLPKVPVVQLIQISKVYISIVNREILDDYRFVGNASLQESGSLYEQAAAMSAKSGMPKPMLLL
jgi:hypothetical protein